MIMSIQQKRDRDMCSVLWYMVRDFGDIRVQEEDRWNDLIDMADNAGREYPELKRVICKVLDMIETRAVKRREEEEKAAS